MATLKELNLKIVSLKETRKITSAMKLISTTRFNKMQGVIRKSHIYLEALNDLYGHVAMEAASKMGSKSSEKREGTTLEDLKGRIKEVILFTSDRGLCGSFNHAVIKFFVNFLEKNRGRTLHVSFVGRRGYEYFKQSPYLAKTKLLEDWTKHPTFSDVIPTADSFIKLFHSDACSDVTIIYNEFISTIAQKPALRQLLPFVKTAESSEAKGKMEARNFIFEPDLKTLAEKCLTEMVRFNLYQTLLQSVTGEHAARMAAMDNATRNCDDLIDGKTLERNRVRQAAITTELTEIISGAEASK